VHLVGSSLRKYITMHGPENVNKILQSNGFFSVSVFYE